MRKIPVILLLAFFAMPAIYGQIKIGDNPQAISPTSVLELESNDRVLVITRINTAQMDAIVPNQGAMVYNTDTQCIHYYDGVQWVNLCNSAGLVFTTDPIVNNVSTVVITDQAGTKNFEVAPNSIGSLQIINGGINGVDIQNGSIGPGKLQDQSVTQEKLSENSVGAFALDNANINLSDFTNDQGFITIADVISTAAGNDITDNGGAFYDDQTLQDDISANTTFINAHITADADTNANNEIQTLSLSGNDLSISLGNTITLPGGGNPTDELITNAVLTGTNLIITEGGIPHTVPLGSLAGGGNPTDELQDLNFNTTTNILTLTNPATVGNFVDLSSLAGGGGNPTLDQVLTQGNDAGAALIRNLADPILAQDAATKAYVDANVGGNQNLAQVLAQGTDGGAALIKNILDPVDPQDAATRAYVLATVASGGALTDGTILIGGAGDVAQQLAVMGDATLANDGTLTIAANAIDTGKIDNDAILLEDLNQNLAGDGQIIKWNNTAGLWEIADDDTGTATLTDGNIFVGGAGDVPTDVTMSGDATIDNIGELTIADDAIELNMIAQNLANDGDVMRWDDATTSWIVEAAPGEHTGTANSVFFADDTTGAPTEDNDSFAWDPAARLNSGQLQIGLDGNTAPTDVSKVVIAENPSGGSDVMYPLLIQTSAPAVANASTGILFSPETHGPGTLAKGALIYQRTGDWAIGDFHFLQTSLPNLVKPTTSDKAFSIKNNKDIVIYGGIDIDGAGLGTAGQVLSTTGTGVQWVNAGGGGTDNQNLETATLVGTDLTINIEGGNPTTADLATLTTDLELAAAITASEALDNDMDSANEIQAITSTDASVTITQTGDDFDLSVVGGGTDNQNLETATLAGSDLIITIEDGNPVTADLTALATDAEVTAAIAASDALDLDKDNTNEIQTVSAANGTVVVTPTGIDDFTVAVGTISGGPTGNIAANSITQGDIGVNAVGAGEIDSGAVSSDEISDDSIDDVDISATAGILGTKINPNFGVQNITTTGDISGNDITTTGNLLVGGSISTVTSGFLHADYVFEKYFDGIAELKTTYEFKSLEEIEAFVKRHHHLPGIKSRAQVINEGVWDISASNIQNLEKIEELFLHTIEQENKIKSLQSENDTLNKELNTIKKDLEEIKAMLKKSN